MFNWTIINDVPRGITNSTGAVGTEVITMSPVMTETTLVPKTSGGGVTWSGQVAMGTGVRGAVLTIVAEKMALKHLVRGLLRIAYQRLPGILLRLDG